MSMEKNAQVKQAGASLKDLLEKVAAEHLANHEIAVHNAMANAGFTAARPVTFKSSAFRQLIRETSGLIELALDDE